MADRKPGFSTLAIHAGAQPDPTTGARATPIYQTTSFVFDDVDHAASLFGLQAFGNIYTRIGNPTHGGARGARRRARGRHRGARRRLGPRRAGARLPRADAAGRRVRRRDASSMAARSTSSTTPSRTSAGTWSGPTPTTSRLVREGGDAEDQGDLHRVDRQSGRHRHRHRGDRRRSPTQAGVPLIVDNTLATPYLCKPIEHGADIVVHSLTKFLGGHGNSIGGVIVDGGTFDWSATARYPMLSEPRPEYDGIVLGRDLRQFRLRHRLPRAGPARPRARRSRRSTPS